MTKSRWRQEVSLQQTVFLQGAVVVTLLLLGFWFLSADVVNASTKGVLAMRLTLARQTAARLDLVLERDLGRIGRRMPVFTPGLAAEGGLRAVSDDLIVWPAYAALFDPQGGLLDSEPALPAGLALPRPVLAALDRPDSGVTGLLPDLKGADAVVYLVNPVRDQHGVVAAIALAAIDPARSNIEAFLQPFSLGQTGFAEVVDREGFVIASTQRERLLAKADHSAQFALLIDGGKTTTGTCHSCHDETGGQTRGNEVLAFAPLSIAPWGVAIRQSEDEALAPVRRLLGGVLLLGLASLGAVTLLSWSASRWPVRSAQRLRASARRIAAGDLDTPVPQVMGAEMVGLARSLDSMREALRAARDEMGRWNRDLELTVEARTRELTSLVHASEILVSTAAPKTTFDSIVRTAAGTFGADGAVLFLYDPTNHCLVAKAAVGYDIAALSQVALRPGEGVAGRVFQCRESAMSNDQTEVDASLVGLTADNRRHLLAARAGRELRAFLCVPLEKGEEAIGSLLLAGFEEGVSFSASNVALARTFAHIACALLESLRLLREASEVEALRRSDQLKSVFLSNVSHELQTPLAALRASLDFLRPTDGDAGAHGMLLETASRSAAQLQRLVIDLIDAARLQNLQLRLNPEVLDLRVIVAQTAESFAALTAQRNQALYVSVPDSSLLAFADEHRIQQVLNNLLINAHQYTPEGGEITVSARSSDGEIILSVADSGPGVRPEHKGQLFERFQRGSSAGSHRGLGLGLAIAKGLVELHGGRIWVDSVPGAGAVFSLALREAKRPMGEGLPCQDEPR